MRTANALRTENLSLGNLLFANFRALLQGQLVPDSHFFGFNVRGKAYTSPAVDNRNIAVGFAIADPAVNIPIKHDKSIRVSSVVKTASGYDLMDSSGEKILGQLYFSKAPENSCKETYKAFVSVFLFKEPGIEPKKANQLISKASDLENLILHLKTRHGFSMPTEIIERIKDHVPFVNDKKSQE